MRRPFLVVGLAITACAQVAPPPSPSGPQRFGVAAFGAVDPLAQLESLRQAGFDYVEPALSKLAALSATELVAVRNRLRQSGLGVEATNWFLPAELKVAGPTVDDAAVQRYLEHALPLAATLGAKVVVFGSPASRSVPADFPHVDAERQLLAFLRRCDDVIAGRGLDVTVAIEPLRAAESNVVNTLGEAVALARAVDRPHVRVVCDFYHLAFEHDDPAAVRAAAPWLAHLQIAGPAGRCFPTDTLGETRYAAWFAALRDAGYRGRISIEANSTNIAADAPRSLQFLRRAALGELPQRAAVTAAATANGLQVTVDGAPFALVHTDTAPLPYVGPLLGPGGVPVTRPVPLVPVPGGSNDHPHHRSLWFAHGDVNGFDFWHGKGRRERIEPDGAPQVDNRGATVAVQSRHRWLVDDATLVCRDERELVFGADAGHRWVDVTLTLRADTTPVVFGDTKEGTFALRLHDTLRANAGTGALLTNSDGLAGDAIWGKRARWIDASGKVDGIAVGVAMFDHPQNHAHPTWWHARTYGLLAANPFGVHDFEKQPAGTGALTIAAGDSRTWRWRVLLHDDSWTKERLDTAWRAFATR
jgi:sugar phosphate isomerase/epimerase